MTAFGTTEQAVQAMRLGASQYLVKGEVGGGRLLDIVGSYFREN